jgi:hypothetical protein
MAQTEAEDAAEGIEVVAVGREVDALRVDSAMAPRLLGRRKLLLCHKCELLYTNLCMSDSIYMSMIYQYDEQYITIQSEREQYPTHGVDLLLGTTNDPEAPMADLIML